MKDLYAILEVPKTADPEAIERAYRKRAKATHPDCGGTNEEFHAVDQAYLVLKDPNRRATYDETGQFEEARPDNTKSNAMMVISFYLGKVLPALAMVGKDPKTDNVLNLLKEVMSQAQGEHDKNKIAVKKSIDTAKIAAERFQAKDGPNLVAEMLKFNIAQMEQQILAIDGEKAKIKNALEFLEQYTYRVDKTDRKLFMPGAWRNMSASTSSFFTPMQPKDGEY